MQCFVLNRGLHSFGLKEIKSMSRSKRQICEKAGNTRPKMLLREVENE